MYYARKSRDRAAENRTLLTLTEEQKRELEGRLHKLDGMEPFVRDNRKVMDRLRQNIENNERSEARARKAEEQQEQARVMNEEEEEVDDWWDEAQKEEKIKEEREVVEEMQDESEAKMPPPGTAGAELKKSLEEMKRGAGYQKMLQFRKKLPAFERRSELVRLIRSNQVVVISGETGCGKTTQVPQFVLDDLLERGEGHRARVVCTQPRRISAISIAERVAEERGERCDKITNKF